MPLNNETSYGVRPLTAAINNLPVTPTLIRSLGIFKAEYLTTTNVNVDVRDNVLSLVNAVPRGTRGEGVKQHRQAPKSFNMLHLPKDDVVLADDVQGVRAFGTDNTAETIATKVNDKLAMMKGDIEFSREHLMLGALQGKIINADGTTLVDIYREFGLKRAVYTIDTNEKANINQSLDQIIIAMRKQLSGEMYNGNIVLCGANFLQSLIYHPSLKEVYLRYQEAIRYRDGQTAFDFEHKGINFVLYDYEFEGGTKIADDEAIILPTGTRNTFREYFAPADMNATVNTVALPYYASREKLAHDKGWSLHAQSNPLPLVLRPQAVATLRLG